MKEFIRILSLAAIAFWAITSPAETQTIPTLSVPTTRQCTEGGYVTIPVSRAGPISVSAPFGYKTTDGTAKALVDYQPLVGNQSVRKNARTYTLTLYCRPDNTVYGGNKTLTLTITSRSTGVVIAQGVVTITILENEPAPQPPATELRIESIGATEGTDSVANAQITRTGGDLSQPLFIGWNTVNDTAMAPADYAARSGGNTMGPNVNTITVSFPIVNDTLVEGTEHVGMVARAGTITATGKVPIFDNDVAAPPPPPPPPPPSDVTCSDGTKLPAGSVCPIMTWLPAPLAKGGYARAMINCDSWGTYRVAGPKADGTYEPIPAKILAGNVFRVITWGYAGFGGVGNIWALDLGNPALVFDPKLGGGNSAYFRESCLEGVRPAS